MVLLGADSAVKPWGADGIDAADVACFGETMLLLVPDPPLAPEEAETYRRVIGGAESNVAVHLARAGHRVSWHSALGEDAFGSFIHRTLVAEGIACSVRIDPHRPTGLYVKELRNTSTSVRYYRTGSAASGLLEQDALSVWRYSPRIVHTTGITPALSDDNAAAVDALFRSRGDGLISFDVNYRSALHTLTSADLLYDLCQRADIVFCGLDEAEALWGCVTVEQVFKVLRGPEFVVVKQGSAGASVFHDGQRWDVGPPDVQVVESVGAGDAFAAGFLSGMLRGETLPRCLHIGTEWAGAVLQVYGDLPERPRELFDQTEIGGKHGQ